MLTPTFEPNHNYFVKFDKLFDVYFLRSNTFTVTYVFFKIPFYFLDSTSVENLYVLINFRNWPWIDAVNLKMIQFRDAGLNLMWADDFNRTRGMFMRLHPSNPWHGTETEAPGDEARTLELQDLWPHLALLCAGLALAAAAFCAEIARSRRGAARARMTKALRALLRKLVPPPRPKRPLGARRTRD